MQLKQAHILLTSRLQAMIPDATNLEGYTTADAATDFTPDAAGLYVFRRSIGVDADTKVETFKYEAYYFDGHDYYKVTDLSVTPDGTSYATMLQQTVTSQAQQLSLLKKRQRPSILQL